jgi:hypothetical protein
MSNDCACRPNITLRDRFGTLPLMWASIGGRTKVIQYLLEELTCKNGICHTELSDVEIVRILNDLCRHGNMECIKLVFKLCGMKQSWFMDSVKASLRNGNIMVSTCCFLILDSNEYCYDLCSVSLSDVLTTEIERDELILKLTTNSEYEVSSLFISAALYKLHFDILMLYLRSIDNHMKILDTNLPLFYKCLQIASNTRSAWLNAKEINDGILSCDRYIPIDQLFPVDNIHFKFPHHLSDVDLVNKLVDLACFFRHICKTYPAEELKIEEHIIRVDEMLSKCFQARSMAQSTTMQKFLPSNLYLNSIVRDADACLNGPMLRCVDHGIIKIFSATAKGNTNDMINKLFSGCLKLHSDSNMACVMNPFLRNLRYHSFKFYDKIVQSKTPTRHAHNLFQLKSEYIFARYIPSCIFIFEAISRLIFLAILVDHIATLNPSLIKSAILVIFHISSLLYELGEICNHRFDCATTTKAVNAYFNSSFNRIDITCYSLISLGLLMEYYSQDFYYGVLAISVIFMSISILKYLSGYEPLGKMVFMIFAMLEDLGKFALIFLVVVFGFYVAMFCLCKQQAEHSDSNFAYSTRTSTFLYLLSSAFQNYNSDWNEAFPNHDDKFRWWAIGLQNIFVVFASVMLLNLVIARMSATHDMMNEKSFQEWQYRRALAVKSYLLIYERCPLSMLAPPFNLLPIMVAIMVDYPTIYYRFSIMKEVTVVKTCWSGWVCDVLMGVCGSVICPIFELLIYVLNSIFKISNNFELLVVLCVFPITYPIYIISLIMETFHEKTTFHIQKIPSSDKYQYKIVYHETEIPLTITDKNKCSIFTIKVIRACTPRLRDTCCPMIQIFVQNVCNCTNGFHIEDRERGGVFFYSSRNSTETT